MATAGPSLLKQHDESKKSKITKKDIKLTSFDEGKLAFMLYNVLTQAECAELIKITEEKGYEEALVNVGGGKQQYMPNVRNSHRCIWDSEEQAGRLWNRIKDYIPEVFRGAGVAGLNERLRFLRYDKGQYFKPHFDGQYRRDNGEVSYITVQLYLNEGFKGGSTSFLDQLSGELSGAAVPKTGSVLVFQHDILHEGSAVKGGRKYAMRTDVMYRK